MPTDPFPYLSKHIKTSTDTALLTSSWNRCRDEYNLDPANHSDTSVLQAGQIHQYRERLSHILPVAEKECESLYLQSPQRGFVVLLADTDGTILNVTGDPTLGEKFNVSAGLLPGAQWSERNKGTNGIGTCLYGKQAITVYQSEHYMRIFSGLTCSAAPIHDHHGKLQGVLNISSFPGNELRNQQFHSRELIKLSVQHIEKQSFLYHFEETTIVHFHPRREFLGLCAEALLAVNDSGKVVAANKIALGFLGLMDSSKLIDLRIDEVLPLPLSFFDVDAHRQDAPNTIYVRDQLSEGRGFFVSVSRNRLPARKHRTLVTQEAATVSFRPPSSAPEFDLDSLAGTDPVMLRITENAKRILDKSISILLTGETGTGKEMVAQALHLASSRFNKPLIAKNCAAIPEALIESELFGHLPGAFTGCNPKGMKGCVLEADDGTLFLDEIGDMPLTMQSRLLRVLESKTVQPLGGSRSIAVNVQVISSTNHDLDALMDQGKFRKDLYYRLAGITLALPPLRQRQDFKAQIRRMIYLENDSGHTVRIESSTYNKLLAYHWPGNYRELRNIIRLMLSLAQGKTLGARHIPAYIVHAIDSHSQLKQEDERSKIIAALTDSRWNLSKTATALQISRSTLYRKLNQYRIRESDQ